MQRKICDFHMHSLFSDGDLLPAEIVRRTQVLGHRAIAITDHADGSNLEQVISVLSKASSQASKYSDGFSLIPGVELTHVPPGRIADLASLAKRLGAKIVVVHGETPVEPVAYGTDAAACSCPDVDILAHPGLISEESVEAARQNGIFLELSFRGGHCLGNGLVAAMAKREGAALIVDSDAHTVGDHMSPEDAFAVARGSGLSKADAERVLYQNPLLLLKRLGID